MIARQCFYKATYGKQVTENSVSGLDPGNLPLNVTRVQHLPGEILALSCW